MPNVIMLSVIMLSVVMLSVVAPLSCLNKLFKSRFFVEARETKKLANCFLEKHIFTASGGLRSCYRTRLFYLEL
jgi:hypothetical protein